MLDKAKTDPALGKQIQDHLKKLNMHTPSVIPALSGVEKVDLAEKLMTEVLRCVGFDLTDDSMKETPRRVAKLLVNEKFWGLYPENFPKIMTIENKMGYNQMLLERDIPVMSCCEHHLEAIIGKATVAYIPKDKVIGLSKLNRVVEYFSRRPQVQERLTQQILNSLQFILNTENVACSITALHQCVQCRGISHIGCSTTTNCFGGVFLEDASAREELLKFI